MPSSVFEIENGLEDIRICRKKTDLQGQNRARMSSGFLDTNALLVKVLGSTKDSPG